MNAGANEPDPPSPCIDVCVVDESQKRCIGCYRTLDEIAAWSTMSAEEKRRVIAELEHRQR